MKKQAAGTNKKGSALLGAVIIMAVLMMLSLSLLLVSYSLFSTANKQMQKLQCRELAQTLSKELEEEIVRQPFSSYEEQAAAMENGRLPLWFYLRYNVWQSSWPYYNSDERGHTSTYAYRYFTLETTSGEDEGWAAYVDGISVLMYWESEAGADKEDTVLRVEVSCQRGNQRSAITSTYELILGDTGYGGVAEGEETADAGAFNPNLNTIQKNEVWSWALSARE